MFKGKLIKPVLVTINTLITYKTKLGFKMNKTSGLKTKRLSSTELQQAQNLQSSLQWRLVVENFGGCR